MSSFRDRLVAAAILSSVEAYAVLHFAPHYKPTGSLGGLTVWFFVANIALLLLYSLFIYPFLLSPLRKAPGPPGGNFIIGHGSAQFARPAGVRLLEWVNSVPNDGIIYFRGFFNRDVVMPTSHETLRTVLSDNPYDYEKPSSIRKILRRVLGDGLVCVEGATHRFQRKHLNPAFQLNHIRELYPMFWFKSCELTSLLGAENDSTATFEIEFGGWTTRATLDIIGIAGFGRDFNSLKHPDDELVEKYHELLEPDKEKLLWFTLNILCPQWIITRLPWEINRKVGEIQTYLYDFALTMVAERRAEFKLEKSTTPSSAGKNDILSLLVRSGDFSDHDLAEQVLTIMAAGHETTSSTLSWCAFLLSLNPDVQSQLRQEVRAALPSPESGIPINAAQIDALTLLNAVCMEVLRLYPTVPATSRDVVNETHLGGYKLPVGTHVILAPWAINKSHYFWGKDAEEFRPQRWINSDGTINKNGGTSTNYAQLTFLHGPRSCIGQGFAQSELKCLLAAFVGKFQFELAKDSSEYVPAGLVTTKPANGMWLRVRNVEGW